MTQDRELHAPAKDERRARGVGSGAAVGPRRGINTVEFALVLPLFFTIVLVSVQLAMVAVQYYSVIHVARATARSAAVNPDRIDSVIDAEAKAISLPGVGTTGISSVAISPSCTSLTSGRCSNRLSGEPISVTVTPNVSKMIFLPTSFRLGTIQISLPTTLPGYRVSQVIE